MLKTKILFICFFLSFAAIADEFQNVRKLSAFEELGLSPAQYEEFSSYTHLLVPNEQSVSINYEDYKGVQFCLSEFVNGDLSLYESPNTIFGEVNWSISLSRLYGFIFVTIGSSRVDDLGVLCIFNESMSNVFVER